MGKHRCHSREFVQKKLLTPSLSKGEERENGHQSYAGHQCPLCARSDIRETDVLRRSGRRFCLAIGQQLGVGVDFSQLILAYALEFP
jgi:hypothetical protein